MKLTKQINFQDVGGLTRLLQAERITRTRFSIEISEKDACNGIYAAFRAEVADRGGVMSMDEDTRQHIVSAAQWLINPEEKTGLLLCGLCGNGKTTLATSIARLIAYVTEKEFGYSQRKTMPLYTGKDICELKANTKAYDDYKKVLSEEMIIIDDMGHEPSEVQSFGMTHTPVVDVIEHRYRKNLMTIITTNLLPDELSEKYQIRVYDRLKEMMKVIPFRNESYRD